MPILEFRCPKCNTGIEKLLYGSEIDSTQFWCDECKSEMERCMPSRVFFRGFEEQIIEGVDDKVPCTGYRDMKRKARSWKDDEEQKLLVDNAPMEKERLQKMENLSERRSEESSVAKQEAKNA